MKIKRKFKQFMAIWLQDELMDIAIKTRGIGCSTIDVVQVTNEFETIKSEFVIAQKDFSELAYERAIDEMHRHMYEFVKGYIKINNEELTSLEYQFARVIRFTLKLGKN